MKKILTIICLILFLPLGVSAQNATVAEKTCSDSDGIICLNIPIGGLDRIDINTNAFGTYLQTWYSFIIGSIGVIATVMMMWGGFKWLTSRGNSGTISDAKQIIWSALTGVVLAFLSYSILYFINPATTRIGLPQIISYRVDVKVPNFQSLQGSGGEVNQTKAPPSGVATVPLCPPGNQAVAIDYSNVEPRNTCQISSSHQSLINKYVGSNGKKANILSAIMAAETTCGANNRQSSAGACGIMQIMPDTARGILRAQENNLANATNEQICNTLATDDELSIALATTYVNNSIDQGIDNPADIFAGYNAGTAQGEGKALGPSRDCGGEVKAYQCCKDPGGLAETQNYVNKTMAQYNHLNQTE